MGEGFFLQIWRAGLAEYDEPEGIAWKWQSSDGVMVKAPFCADRGYHGGPARKAIETRDYVPHVRQRGEEVEAKETIPGCKPRRWIEEVAHSWFNRFRKLRVRYEKLRETPTEHFSTWLQPVFAGEKLELFTDKY